VGATVDNYLLKTVGKCSLLMSVAIIFILFWCETKVDMMAVVGISAFLLILGGGMLYTSKRQEAA
jgi:hypothetical protein